MYAAFLDTLAQARRAPFQEDEEFEVKLATFIEQARQRWPTPSVTDEQFARYVAERIADDLLPAAALQQMRGPELLLSCACAQGDNKAISELERNYFQSVDRALGRLSVTADVADEAKQMLRTRLFVAAEQHAPKITRYAGRGDLGRWLNVVATREALAIVSNPPREVQAPDELWENAAAQESLELEFLKRRCREVFNESVAKAVTKLSPRDRTLLRLGLVQRVSIDRIGEMYNVHRATAARWLQSARQELVSATRKSLLARLNLNRADAESVMRLINSQLDVSLGNHLVPE